MNLKEQIETIIERDNLREPNRKQEVVFKKIALAKILINAKVTTSEIGRMFNNDHSTIVHRIKKHSTYKKYRDFKEIEEGILLELDLISDEKIREAKEQIKKNKIEILEMQERTNDLRKFVRMRERYIGIEVFDESLRFKILFCTDYYQMVKLQEFVKESLTPDQMERYKEVKKDLV